MTGEPSLLDRAVRDAAVTQDVVVAPGAIEAAAGLLGRVMPGKRFALVADDHTMAAAGTRAVQALAGTGLLLHEPIILHGAPRLKPHAETARGLAVALQQREVVPLAIGSGVINDLAKYAAGLAGIPYACVATAASMDGYAASGAALLDGGFKRTMACPPPVVVIADLDIIAAAPARMAGWGYGDIAGKIVAGADWQLADALGEEAIGETAFALVQDNVRGWLSRPGAIAAGDADAIGGLVTGLLVAGFAMQAHGNSRPASGCEHLISHVWEMEGLHHDGEPAAHGACVGVGTVAILALYEWFLAQDVAGGAVRAIEVASSLAEAEAEVAAAFVNPAIADSALVETRAKFDRGALHAERMRLLAARWPVLRETLANTLVPPAEMAGWLAACGAAAHPGDLGVPLARLAKDCRRARLIRRRYTLLDLLDELGWLDRAIAATFGPGGYWAGAGMRQLGD